MLLLRLLSAAGLQAALVKRGEGPCDIYAAAGTPCVAAHSTVRALYASYPEGAPLYILSRASDNRTLAVGALSSGFANATAQVEFCTIPLPTRCTIERIVDQSGTGNHLDRVMVVAENIHGWPVDGINAMRDELSVGGNSVFSAYFEGGTPDRSGTMGFRANPGPKNNGSNLVARGDDPESMYMVTSGKHYNSGCCFDYGNSEVAACGSPGFPPCGIPDPPAPSPTASAPTPPGDCPGCGEMESINWSDQRGNPSDPKKSVNHVGTGAGPWIMADLERGVWAGNDINVTKTNTPLNNSDFVTAMLKGKPGRWALKGGDAQKGELKTMYDGPRPPGYDVMQKQGAIVLGIGGDNSDRAVGTFYEGAITASYTTDETDKAVHANILAAGYGR